MSNTSNNDDHLNTSTPAPIDRIVFKVQCQHCGRVTVAREANQEITKLTGNINTLIKKRDSLQRILDKKELDKRRALERKKSKDEWDKRRKDA